MGVGLKYQLPAVLMALPFANYFHVHASLDCARDVHSAQAPVSELRKAEPTARVRQRLARFANREEAFVVPFSTAKFFNERSKLREDRNEECLLCFAPVKGDPPRFQINIAPPKRAGLGLPCSGHAYELDKVAALLRVSVEPLRANVGHYRLELLEGRSQPNRIHALLVLRVSCRRLDDDLV